MDKNLKTINLIETYIEKGEEAACLLLIEIFHEPVNVIITKILKERGFTDKIIEAANTDFFAYIFLNVEKIITTSEDIADVIFEFAIFFIDEHYQPESRDRIFEKVEQYKRYEVLPEKLRFLLIDKHINNFTDKELAEKYDLTMEEVLSALINAELVANNFCLN